MTNLTQKSPWPPHCLPPPLPSPKQSTTKLGHKYIRVRKNTRSQHPTPSTDGRKQENQDNQAHTWPAPMALGLQRLPWRDGAAGRTPEGRLCLGAAQTESWDSVCWFVYFGVSHPHTEKAERSGVGFDLISCLWVSLGIPPSSPPHHLPRAISAFPSVETNSVERSQGKTPIRGFPSPGINCW